MIFDAAQIKVTQGNIAIHKINQCKAEVEKLTEALG